MKYEASQPMAAMALAKVKHHTELFQFERDTHQGPLFGEGANHFYWAGRCDGVRCDMAMLLLNDVFDRTWRNFPLVQPPPRREFWEEAIPAVKAAHSDFLLLAEVYWELEERLQSLGFNYTYDKHLYDDLVRRNPAGAQRRLLELPPKFVAASAHFLENHDEPRVAALLSLPEHRTAALTILARNQANCSALDHARPDGPKRPARRECAGASA